MIIIKYAADLISLAAIIYFIVFLLVSFIRSIVRRIRYKEKIDLLDILKINIYKDIINKNKIKSTILFISALALVLFTNTAFLGLFGYSSLNSTGEGTYCYYVEAATGNRSYTVPAEIYIYIDSDEYGAYQRVYLNRLIMDTQDINFEYSDYLEINEISHQTDNNGRDWQVKLLNKKAYSSRVSETEPKNTIELILLSIVVISILHIWITSMIDDNKESAINGLDENK